MRQGEKKSVGKARGETALVAARSERMVGATRGEKEGGAARPKSVPWAQAQALNPCPGGPSSRGEVETRRGARGFHPLGLMDFGIL